MKDLVDRKKELETEVALKSNKIQGIKNEMQKMQDELNKETIDLVGLSGQLKEIDYIIKNFSEESETSEKEVKEVQEDDRAV